jgi:hypothetical protein
VYFAEHPPAVEIRGGLAFIRPDGAHCEIALTPHTLRLFVVRANRELAAWNATNNIVEMRARG